MIVINGDSLEMKCVTLPEPYVMVKRLPNGFVYGCILCVSVGCMGVCMHLCTPMGGRFYAQKNPYNMHAQIHSVVF